MAVKNNHAACVSTLLKHGIHTTFLSSDKTDGPGPITLKSAEDNCLMEATRLRHRYLVVLIEALKCT